MTKQTMIKAYRRFSAADSYILGFKYKHEVYMVAVDEIKPRFLTVGQASRNRGENLRFMPKNKHKLQLLKKGAICLGNESCLEDDTYNKGEIFEKLVTEYYGQTWAKDCVPFWIDGDIHLGEEKIQIKFEQATLLNTSHIKKLRGLTTIK